MSDRSDKTTGQMENGSANSSQGKPAKKKSSKSVPRLQEDQFHLPCEWGDCQVVKTKMSTFSQHVSDHIMQYFSQLTVPVSSGACFTCGWRDCGAQILGSLIDFNRHVYFHAFHVRLKCLGAHLAHVLGLGKCMLGSQSCNWIPELPENLQCAWGECKIIFDNPFVFYCHVCYHVDEYLEGKSVLNCLWKDCDKNFQSKHRLKEHLRSHTQEKQVACPTCGGLFCSHTKLSDHILRQAHSDMQRYECSHCNRRFSTERMLREHMRRHVNRYKCPLCEMTCPTPCTIRQHMKYRHSEEKPFKCGHCEFSAKSSADLRKHLDSHNVEDQFSCHIVNCPFSARYYSSLALHYKKHHQSVDIPRYKCHICDKTFGRGYTLTFHLKKKHLFQWPPGHIRFRYQHHADGFFRLQTVRYESVDISSSSSSRDSLDTCVNTTSGTKTGIKKNVVLSSVPAPQSSSPPDGSGDVTMSVSPVAAAAVVKSCRKVKRNQKANSSPGSKPKKSRKKIAESEILDLQRNNNEFSQRATENNSAKNHEIADHSSDINTTVPTQNPPAGYFESELNVILAVGSRSNKKSHRKECEKQNQKQVNKTQLKSECPLEAMIIQQALVSGIEPQEQELEDVGHQENPTAGASVRVYTQLDAISLRVKEYRDSAEANLHMLGDVALTSLGVPEDKTASVTGSL